MAYLKILPQNQNKAHPAIDKTSSEEKHEKNHHKILFF